MSVSISYESNNLNVKNVIGHISVDDISADHIETNSINVKNLSSDNVQSSYLYGVLKTSEQPEITSIGTLTSLNVSGTVTGLNKSMVDLGNVDNTSDADKPISTATQNAITAISLTPGPTGIQGPTGVQGVQGDKGDIGIQGPTGVQGDKGDKGDIGIQGPTGIVSGVTKSMVGLGNVDNTSDLVKPISTATQDALNLKAPINNPTFTGDVRIENSKNWTQLGLDIDGEASGDESGYSVSLSSDGTTVAIGARYNDGNSGSSDDNRGHVRVYKWIDSTLTWDQLGGDIDGDASGDNSGWSVSLSSDGTIVAIGAIYNDGNSGSSDDNRGHVRVYKWNGNNWTQLGGDIDGEASGNNSGWSVSLSSDGTTVAIGAINNSTYRGHVRVYKWNGSTLTWDQLGLDIDGETFLDESGWSVSLSSDGKTVAIGATGNDGNGGSSSDNRGHVRVYKWNNSTLSWNKLGLDIDGEASGDGSGWSVSLSSDGTIVAIGARGNDGTSTNLNDNRGHVRVYKWNVTSWSQLGLDIDGEASGDNSGYSVSLSSDGTIVAIGATENDGNGNSSGHVRVYKWNDSTLTWNKLELDIDGEASGDGSGWSVSLSGDGTTVAIGAPYNDRNSDFDRGHVRVYKLTTFRSLNLYGTDIQINDGTVNTKELIASNINITSIGVLTNLTVLGNVSGIVKSSSKNSNDSGNFGDLSTDGTNLYICIGINSWKKIILLDI
jgi:hypothetical protein